MDFVPLVVAALMINTALALLKHARAKQWSDAATIIVAFAAGVLVTGLLRLSDFASGVEVGGLTLNELNTASVVLVGFAMASAARTVHQTLKAVDNQQSAAEPKLFPPA